MKITNEVMAHYLLNNAKSMPEGKSKDEQIKKAQEILTPKTVSTTKHSAMAYKSSMNRDIRNLVAKFKDTPTAEIADEIKELEKENHINILDSHEFQLTKGNVMAHIRSEIRGVKNDLKTRKFSKDISGEKKQEAFAIASTKRIEQMSTDEYINNRVLKVINDDKKRVFAKDSKTLNKVSTEFKSRKSIELENFKMMTKMANQIDKLQKQLDNQ
jgi:hypothetical protein